MENVNSTVALITAAGSGALIWLAHEAANKFIKEKTTTKVISIATTILISIGSSAFLYNSGKKIGNQDKYDEGVRVGGIEGEKRGYKMGKAAQLNT